MNKASVLLLLLILASTSIISAEAAFAQSIPKPSVPEFTIKYVDNSYYIPPTYGIDEYSGQTVQIGGGFTYENRSIELRIKNQPFAAYNDGPYGDSNHIDLYYQIRYKGHFGEDWHYYSIYRWADSDYTVHLFGVEWEGRSVTFPNLASGEKIDFQVQALIGYYTKADNQPMLLGPWVDDFHGESSGYNAIQTFTMPGTSDLTTSPLPTSTVPEFPMIAILPLLVIIPLVATVFLRKKQVLT